MPGRDHNYSVSAKAVQDTYSEHFFNEGAVPWQSDLVPVRVFVCVCVCVCVYAYSP